MILKNNKVGGLIQPDFNIYYTKTVWYRPGDWHIYHWDVSLELDPYMYDELIFNKGAKKTEWKKDNFFFFF